MMVARSFDLWQKDAFFSAAEEVQESADIMDSAFRLWEKEKSKGLIEPEYLDELCRELQTALGTAKWQLEEFNKAVKLSHRKSRSDNSKTRHNQFVTAIECQISRVEAALKGSLLESGKQPLCWVHLDKDECDDLAMFLSGTSGTSSTSSSESHSSDFSSKSFPKENQYGNVDLNHKTTHNHNVGVGKSFIDAQCSVEADPQVTFRVKDVISSQDEWVTGSQGSESSLDRGEWRITISDDSEQRKTAILYDDISKEKGFKPRYWKILKAKTGASNIKSLRGIRRFNQLFVGVCGYRRQSSSPSRTEHGWSVRVKLALMLMIFLIAQNHGNEAPSGRPQTSSLPVIVPQKEGAHLNTIVMHRDKQAVCTPNEFRNCRRVLKHLVAHMAVYICL